MGSSSRTWQSLISWWVHLWIPVHLISSSQNRSRRNSTFGLRNESGGSNFFRVLKISRPTLRWNRHDVTGAMTTWLCSALYYWCLLKIYYACIGQIQIINWSSPSIKHSNDKKNKAGWIMSIQQTQSTGLRYSELNSESMQRECTRSNIQIDDSKSNGGRIQFNVQACNTPCVCKQSGSVKIINGGTNPIPSMHHAIKWQESKATFPAEKFNRRWLLHPTTDGPDFNGVGMLAISSFMIQDRNPEVNRRLPN